MPERMDLKLDAGNAGRHASTSGGTIKLAGTYLYGPPAASLAIEGEVIVQAGEGRTRRLPGLSLRPDDEKIANVREALEDLPETAADGTATVQVKLPKLEKTARAARSRCDPASCAKRAAARSSARVTLPVDLEAAAHRHQAGFADDQAREGETNASRSSWSMATARRSTPRA